MRISIDPHSGFCFGVVHAIEVAERELKKEPRLYCLGDIVHNNMEVDRLKRMGLMIISHEDLVKMHDCKVMIRAHGEPPETYKTALLNNIELIDASCPIVLNLQNMIHRGYLEMQEKNGQVVIYGKEGHAEVNGLNGQANGTAIVVNEVTELSKIDFSRPVRLFSQTTMSTGGFSELSSLIRQRMEMAASGEPVDFEVNDSICRQVSNRAGLLRDFAAKFDVILFVSGKKSSNGRILFDVCSEANPNSHFISGPEELNHEWFVQVASAGICGATSTPRWLMEEVEKEILKISH